MFIGSILLNKKQKISSERAKNYVITDKNQKKKIKQQLLIDKNQTNKIFCENANWNINLCCC